MSSASIPLHDAASTTWALIEIVGKVESGQVEDLVQLGLSHQLINKLRQLPTGELLRLSQMSMTNPLFRISFNEDAFNLALHKLNRVNEESELLEQFVRLGASPSMLAQFFNAPAAVITDYRKALNVPAQTGRPRLPACAIRDQIHQQWQKLSSVADVRHRYLTLQRQFADLNLMTLHAVVNEFAD